MDKKPLYFYILLLCCLYKSSWAEMQKPDVLTIISPHWEGITKSFDLAFKNWYKQQTNKKVKINWLSQSPRFIELEFQRKQESIGVDIYFGGGVDTYMMFAEKGYFTSYKIPQPQLRQLPKHIYGIPIYDPGYQWYAATISSFGIMQNEELRKKFDLPRVTTWEDLTQYELRGKIGAADPRLSGSALMIYEIILQKYGWKNGLEIITKIGANVKGFLSGSNLIPKQIVRGQVIYGMTIDFYAYAEMAKLGDRIKYILPSDAAVIAPDSIGILKGAPNIEISKKFVDFVLSESGQKLWVLSNTDPEGPKWNSPLYRPAIIPRLYETLGQRCTVPNPFAQKIVPIQYDPIKGGTRWKMVRDLVGVLIVDFHRQLASTWKLINECSIPEKREAALDILVQIPITENEATQISINGWEDQNFRNRKLKEWSDFTRKKFRLAKKAVN